MEKNWHYLSFEKVAQLLNTDLERGLKESEVDFRIKKFGKNIFKEKEGFSNLNLFLAQFKNPLILILIFAFVLALALKSFGDSLVIFLAIFASAIFGFLEERKSNKILEKIRKYLKPKAVVLREGERKQISAENLVPGDIIFFEAGDRIPADARICEAWNLKIDESFLTGEWFEVRKTSLSLKKELSLGERGNMVYAGSLVTSGKGKGIVVATGKDTELGKIAFLTQKLKERKTPLQEKFSHFSKLIAFIISFVSLIIFILGLLKGKNFLEIFETSIAIMVGGIPEALPIVMTVILAIGARKILSQKGLIRKLNSVETLGSAKIICFDKTRTLTKGEMEITRIVSQNEALALKIAVLCNNAFIENPASDFRNWRIIGSATDKALILSAARRGVLKPQIEKEVSQIVTFPFDTQEKILLTFLKEKGKTFIYVSGAPEKILERSPKKTFVKRWQKELEKMTSCGLRVVGAGYKEIKNFDFKKINLENLKEKITGFKMVALIGLKDVIREGAKQAIKIAQQAGLKPIIVTGDHKNTAFMVAKEVGLEVRKKEVMEAKEFEKLSLKELLKKIEVIKIFARMSYEHKIKIIEAWQRKGEVVAMIGDGVNDALALKRADIGVALGSGTEVAKEASDLILLDDSFNTLIASIKGGRVILDNLRKAISYVMANSFASAIIVGGALLLGWPLPILGVQILWNNIIEDSLPNLAFAFEPEEKEVMKRKPSSLKEPLLTKEMKVLIFLTGTIYQALGLLLFGILWKKFHLDLTYCRTMVFGLLVLNSAFVVFGYKNLKKSLFKSQPFSNPFLNFSALIVILFFGLSIYLPWLRKLLSTVPLGFSDWLILIALSFLSLMLIEFTKIFFRVKNFKNKN